MIDDDYLWEIMKPTANVTIKGSGGTAYNAATPSYTYSIDSSTTAGFNGTTGVIASGTGTNAIWTATTPYTISGTGTGTPYTLNKNGKMVIQGQEADIDINGKSLKTWMQTVEQRLAILEPNPKLEAEWDELKELGDRYRALEKEINEKMKTWNILKD